jgi:NAD(P)H-dependent flavin oxidoreductase YrpB (nitropropane dioxygenase family)
MWPDNRILELFHIAIPIIQAPMAGAVLSEMVVAVSEAGGLGSLPCATLSVEQARGQLEAIRQQTTRPINVNFFCHQHPHREPASEIKWRQRLENYYREFALETQAEASTASRAPFNDKMCELVEEFILVCRKKISSNAHGKRARRLFLPEPPLMKPAGWKIKDATQSSRRDTKPAATAACFSQRMRRR